MVLGDVEEQLALARAPISDFYTLTRFEETLKKETGSQHDNLADILTDDQASNANRLRVIVLRAIVNSEEELTRELEEDLCELETVADDDRGTSHCCVYGIAGKLYTLVPHPDLQDALEVRMAKFPQNWKPAPVPVKTTQTVKELQSGILAAIDPRWFSLSLGFKSGLFKNEGQKPEDLRKADFANIFNTIILGDGSSLLNKIDTPFTLYVACPPKPTLTLVTGSTP